MSRNTSILAWDVSVHGKDEDGQPVTLWAGPLRDYLEANRDGIDACEAADIVATLIEGDEYRGGGGAAPAWTLSRIEDGDEEQDEPPYGWDKVEGGEETPLDTPCLDTSFHDHEMDVDDAAEAVAEALGGTVAYLTEPTPIGNQFVIPGCEHDQARGPEQMDLLK